MTTRQAGSTVGFVVVGVVLALMFISGVYLIRHQASGPVAVKPAEHKPAPASSGQSNKQSSEQNKPSKAPAPSASSNDGPIPVTGVQLPHTGIASTAYSLGAVCVLTYIGICYARSRRLSF